MYNIEKKPVQAQIQAYGEFTKRGEKERRKWWQPATGPAIQNTKRSQKQPSNLKVWEDKVLAKKYISIIL